ncbi:unnamed protein product, partial [Prorocentrum cordatum]
MLPPAGAARPGRRSEEASLEAADDSAAESDAGEQRRLLRGGGGEGRADGTAPRRPSRRWRRSGAVASASLLLAAAAALRALAPRGRGRRRGEVVRCSYCGFFVFEKNVVHRDPAPAVSLAALTESRHLCEDRDTFRLALGTYTSQASCLHACEHTSGCTGRRFAPALLQRP